MRRIFHVDMNSFFASCEEANDPSLKGKKIAVAGDPAKRHGIILAASYPAKACGVKTTMPIWKALNVCPNLILLPCNFELYRDYSEKMLDILASYAPVIEKASIDEAYLDLTGTEMIYPDLKKLAEEIQNRILKELNLRCSIGISENKLLAKMGSDFKKPLGITELFVKDVKEKMWPLDVGELFLVGRKTEETLKKIGIYKIGDLAKYDYNTLKLYFGEKGARRLIDNANGLDDSPVTPNDEQEAKSNGAETTFSEDIKDIEKLKKVLFEFSEKIAKNLRECGKKAKTIVIKIKYENFTVITRNLTIPNATDLSNEIYENAVLLLDKNLNREYKVRLIGLSCTNYVSSEDDFTQITLLESDYEKAKNMKKEKLSKLDKVSDLLRDKYGDNIIVRARNLEKLTEEESEELIKNVTDSLEGSKKDKLD